MLYFIILDDDVRHNKSTEKRLEAIFEKYNIEAEISLSTTKANDVIEYSSKNKLRNNVYILDVDVQSNINGIDVAGIIREQETKAYIVFVSAHPEYVMPSLKTRIFDYLIKPISAQTFTECITSIYKDFSKVNSQKEQQLAIKSGFNVYTLGFEEITFFEKYGHILVVHTVSGKIQSTESLESIECKIDKEMFFRCHKSFIVNLSHISRIDYSNNIIYLKNAETCPVSKRCKKELKALCSTV